MFLKIYFSKLNIFLYFSISLSNAINGKDDSKMVNIYLTLFEDNDCENSVIGRLTLVHAPFLKTFAVNTATYWYANLKEKFSWFVLVYL